MEKPARAPWSRRPPLRSGAQVAHYASLLVAFVLILYAALTFVDLLPTASAQAFSRLGY